MTENIEYRSQTNNPMNVFLVALLIGAALIIGVLYSEVRNLRGQNNNVVANTTNNANNGNNNPSVVNTGTANQQPQETFPTVARTSIEAVTANDHIQGNVNAEVVLIEYSDFDCPFCTQFHPTMEKIKSEYGDKVAWVYRHMPLPQLHPGATKEAEASECAAEIGGKQKFWTYSNALFQKNHTVADLVTLAGQQGMNSNTFKTCLDSGKYTQKVTDQANKGQMAGIRGTPGTILLPKSGDGKLIAGAYPYESVKMLVDQALSAN